MPSFASALLHDERSSVNLEWVCGRDWGDGFEQLSETPRVADPDPSRATSMENWRLRFQWVPRESGAKPELSRNCERGAFVRQTPLR